MTRPKPPFSRFSQVFPGEWGPCNEFKWNNSFYLLIFACHAIIELRKNSLGILYLNCRWGYFNKIWKCYRDCFNTSLKIFSIFRDYIAFEQKLFALIGGTKYVVYQDISHISFSSTFLFFGLPKLYFSWKHVLSLSFVSLFTW